MKYSKDHTIYVNQDGIEVPSVTTILKILNKPFLTKWANIMGFRGINVDNVLEETSRIGTLVHGIVRAFVMKYYYIWIGDYSDKQTVIRYFDSFLSWYKKNKVEPIFTEQILVSDRFGGTCDFYGLINDKYTILDYKTSKRFYATMFLQLAAYCMILESQGKQVDQVAILLLKNKGEAEPKFIQRTELEPYIEAFKKLLDLFHTWYDLNIRDGWGNILEG
jgi:hypothetical protein